MNTVGGEHSPTHAEQTTHKCGSHDFDCGRNDWIADWRRNRAGLGSKQPCRPPYTRQRLPQRRRERWRRNEDGSYIVNNLFGPVSNVIFNDSDVYGGGQQNIAGTTIQPDAWTGPLRSIELCKTRPETPPPTVPAARAATTNGPHARRPPCVALPRARFFTPSTLFSRVPWRSSDEMLIDPPSAISVLWHLDHVVTLL